jgi:hypothetical protein
MLAISAEQFTSITQDHFFNRVSAFLSSRSKHEKLLEILKDNVLVKSLWQIIWDEFSDQSELHLATMFTYVLACHCEGEKPLASLYNALDKENPYLFMQRYYSDLSYLRLCELEFDYEQDDQDD